MGKAIGLGGHFSPSRDMAYKLGAQGTCIMSGRGETLSCEYFDAGVSLLSFCNDILVSLKYEA